MTEPTTSKERNTFGRAANWSVAMSLGNQLTTTLAAFVIAAILGPEAFGTVALAILFLLFVQLFLEQGITTTIVQRKNLTADHLNAAFWIVIATAAGLLIGTLLLAGWWADVTNAPELEAVLRVMSPIIVIEALTVVQQALLQRTLEFKQLALRANVAAIVGGVVGVTAAFAGAGVWALVAQQLTTKLVALVLLWVVGTWRPSFRFSRKAAAELYGFSSRVFLGKAGTFAQSQFDSIVIGVAVGPIAVGLYRLALRVTRTIVNAFSKPVALAALPAFSRAQDDRALLDVRFREAVGRSAGVVIPLVVGAAAVSDLLFDVLGEEWSGAAAVLVAFAVLASARSVNNLCGPMLMATGRPGTVAALSWSLSVINVTSFLAVAWLVRAWGPADQAFAMAVARTATFTVLYLPVTVSLALRASGTTLQGLLAEMLPPLASVPAIVVGARVAVMLLGSVLDDWLLLLAAVASGGIAGLAVLLPLSPLWREFVTRSLLLVRRPVSPIQ